MKRNTIPNSDDRRLRKAGWVKRKKGWKSPYSGNFLTTEHAVRVELMMSTESV